MRNADGTFAKGWKGGPGRPRREAEAHYLQAISEAVPMEVWKRIIQRAVEDALVGDHQARRWLTDYLVGAPGPNMNTLQAIAVNELSGKSIDDSLSDAAEKVAQDREL